MFRVFQKICYFFTNTSKRVVKLFE
ncbi:hypothetical protein LUU34_00262900 [Aix galericulata]|nr:hypothetical protein LUU34_00262900 [Aix galericulata]